MNQESRALYAIGRVSKAFGIRGEVVILPMTESLERFKRLKRIYLGRTAKETDRFTIEYVRVGSRGVRLKLVETPDRTKAELLVGSLIFVDEKQRVEPKRGAHFIHDVVGLAVLDEHNNNLGIVKDVLRMPAQDVYVVEYNGHEWMIPAVKEFVMSIDVATKTMRVKLIDGLVDR